MTATNHFRFRRLTALGVFHTDRFATGVFVLSVLGGYDLTRKTQSIPFDQLGGIYKCLVINLGASPRTPSAAFAAWPSAQSVLDGEITQ
jgi:hypothetical protein